MGISLDQKGHIVELEKENVLLQRDAEFGRKCYTFAMLEMLRLSDSNAAMTAEESK